MDKVQGPTLTLEIKNEKPVDLLVLAASLEAYANQYQTFVRSTGHDVEGENVRLYVQEMRSGSIIAEFISLAEQISLVADHLDALGGFVTHIREISEYYLGKRETKSEVSDKELQRVSDFYEITAQDQGSQINTIVKDGGQVILNVNVTSTEARAIQNGIQRDINKPPEEDEHNFHEELLLIWQARNDLRSKAGDQGKIDRYSEKPLKLLFENDEAKKAILDQDLFHLIFIVSGKVMTADEQPVAYKIYEVHEWFERPE